MTGPTGSGKTISLYAGLSYINHLSRNISTAEDPVEVELEDINQVHIHNKIGLTFAQTLRALLRQDPDVLMLGEIRDFETADIAIKAAQTGHLVLSSLHTNSAVEAVQRLAYLGIKIFNLVDAITLIISQRLVRLLCSQCKRDDLRCTSKHQLFFKQQSPTQIFKAEGCSGCHQGYKGRVGIYEVVRMTPDLKKLFIEQSPRSEIQLYLKTQQHISLLHSGFELIASGQTSIDELFRVLNET